MIRSRYLPLFIQLRLLLTGMTVFPALLIGFFLLIIYAFLDVEGMAKSLNFSTLEETSGVLYQIEETDVRINEKKMYKFYFTFRFDDTGDWNGHSFDNYRDLVVGQEVPILYDPDHPLRSKIEGMDFQISTIPALVLGSFILVGAIIVYFSVRSGLRKIRVLQYGVLADAVLMDKTQTNVRVNKQIVYEYNYEYTVGSTVHTFKIRTHRTGKLTGHKEQIVHNSNYPDRAIAVSVLPKMVIEHIRKDWR